MRLPLLLLFVGHASGPELDGWSYTNDFYAIVIPKLAVCHSESIMAGWLGGWPAGWLAGWLACLLLAG